MFYFPYVNPTTKKRPLELTSKKLRDPSAGKKESSPAKIRSNPDFLSKENYFLSDRDDRFGHNFFGYRPIFLSDQQIAVV